MALALMKHPSFNMHGPRCCKRNTLLAIAEVSQLVWKHIDEGFTVSQPPPCVFTAMNKECRQEGCPFHPSNGRQKDGE